NGQKSHTIGFWVNFDSTGKQKLLELNGTGNFRLVTSDGDLFLVTAGGRHRIGRLPTKQWVHIFLEWKPESKETVVYANGQEYLKMRHASVTTSPQALKAYTFDGTIRDLRLYDYALSPAQRQAVLKNGANPNLKLKVGADTFTPVYYFAR
ncbi:MAG: LamG domain-containing protein, partial [Oceanicoccus sp.]|uniref:LamG-like jellyroll fold domain-containing protein n=1 Tax=Oceanicoccus sp. TaxID=2691044 RepID=UPI0026262EF3